MLFASKDAIKINRQTKTAVCLVTDTEVNISHYPSSIWYWSDKRIVEYFYERYWN